MFDSVSWSDWKALPALPPLTPAVLGEIVDGGQTFRWHRQTDGSWLGLWADCVAQLSLDEKNVLRWRAPEAIAGRVEPALGHYLALDVDFAAMADALPWRSDAHLAQTLAAFPQLRLLRQPFGETLLCFLCSATKQIVQIKQMTALLAERIGSPLSGLPSSESAVRRLPSWSELAGASEKSLRDCLLGFRARYIHETAQFLAAHPGWLEATESLPYAEAKERLCLLPGVGEKVADCVLLFGAGKFEAFPVDVWILKTLAARYGLDGWKPAELAQFGRVHFGPAAGFAQQFLFAWERRIGRTKPVASGQPSAAPTKKR